MTLPYPDSPDVDENIGASISRIEQNLEYLDGVIAQTSFKHVTSLSVEMATRTGAFVVAGAGFQPTAMILHANELTGNSFCWGVATEISSSVDCANLNIDSSYGGGHSSTAVLILSQTSANTLSASVASFFSNGVIMNFTKSGAPTGEVMNMTYVFMR